MHYSQLNLFDTVNGDGCRVSLFVSGCNFGCKGCWNPETWDFKNGSEFKRGAFVTGGTNGMGTVQQYYVEQSNVNVAEELVNLIAAQRAYEINTRAVTASDQILQRVSNLGQ